MQLNDVLTESELNEINLGKAVGGIARGVGAVAGGAAGAWDAAKKGFNQGRAAVGSDEGDSAQPATAAKKNFNAGFSSGRAAVSGDQEIDSIVDAIQSLSDADKKKVLAALGTRPSALPTADLMPNTTKAAATTSSTGGKISSPSAGVTKHTAAKNNPNQPQPTTAQPKPTTAQPKPATARPARAKTTNEDLASHSELLNEIMPASQEEIDVYRHEIKNLNKIIMMLNDIYNRAKNENDQMGMHYSKERIARLSYERQQMMSDLEKRMTREEFDHLREDLEM